MTFEACTCFLLRCDGCGEPLKEDFCELHYTTPDPTDRDVVEKAEECGWTTDDKPLALRALPRAPLAHLPGLPPGLPQPL